MGYRVKCLTLNQIKLVNEEVTECPIDGCDNFTYEEER